LLFLAATAVKSEYNRQIKFTLFEDTISWIIFVGTYSTQN
jgi:hypothetical protein